MNKIELLSINTNLRDALDEIEEEFNGLELEEAPPGTTGEIDEENDELATCLRSIRDSAESALAVLADED